MRTETLARQRESTRERILAAASQLFSRSGFDATTVKDIARECQISDPALYYHFTNKREILSALLVEPPLHRLEMRSASDPAHAHLVDDICRIFDFWAEHDTILRLMFRHALEADQGTQEFSGRMHEAFTRLLQDPLDRIYGRCAGRIQGVLLTLLTGLQLDSLIAFGEEFAARTATPEFRARVRLLVSQALPPPLAQMEGS